MQRARARLKRLALRDVALHAGLAWETLGAALKTEGRLHLEAD